MEEAEPQETTRQIKPAHKRRGLKLVDAIVTLVIVIVIAVLVNTLLHQLTLKREVADARNTTNKAISYIQKKDAPSFRKLGSDDFQAKYTDKQLQNLFNPLSSALSGTQTVVKQTANNGSANKVVSVYYHFTKPMSYYLVVTVIQPNGKTGWHVVNFSGSTAEKDLLKPSGT
jgi:hypothetical protein